MKEFLSDNGWAMAFALASLIASYAVYGYRIQQLENQQSVFAGNVAAITAQQSQIQVELAQININLEYIKKALDLKTGPYSH